LNEFVRLVERMGEISDTMRCMVDRAKSVYRLRYLCSIFMDTDFDKCRVSFGEKMPLRCLFEGDKVHINYLVAPMIILF